MVIFNNIAAMSALNETNKNLNKATKAARLHVSCLLARK